MGVQENEQRSHNRQFDCDLVMKKLLLLLTTLTAAIFDEVQAACQ
jgi:hypothetical protein